MDFLVQYPIHRTLDLIVCYVPPHMKFQNNDSIFLKTLVEPPKQHQNTTMNRLKLLLSLPRRGGQNTSMTIFLDFVNYEWFYINYIQI